MEPLNTVIAYINVAVAQVRYPSVRLRIHPARHEIQRSMPKPVRPLAFAVLLGALGCLLAPGQTHAQTTIIIDREPNAIVAAADGKGTPRTGYPSPTMCKLVQVKPRIFFANAGLALSPLTHFDINSLATEAASKGDTVLSAATRFEPLIVKGYIEAVEEIRRNLPEVYKQQFADGDRVEAAFFGVDPDGTLALCVRVWAKGTSPAGKITFTPVASRNCPGTDCGPNGVMQVILGHRDEIMDFVTQHPNAALEKLGPVESMRFLIQLEIVLQPNSVGPPIDVLTVTSDHAARPFKLSTSVCPEPTPYQEKSPTPAPQKSGSGR
jgi:hypothetical protein